MVRPDAVDGGLPSYVEIVPDDADITVRVALPKALTLGSKTREFNLRRRIKTRSKLWKPLSRSDDDTSVLLRFSREDIGRMRAVVTDLCDLLADFTKDLVTPKVVEEALGITARERIRWTKDGRLPKSGTGTFKKGRHNFMYYLHPSAKIALLVETPSILKSWRDADAAGPA
jgi:hypothetical protein